MLTMSINIDRRIEELLRRQNQGERDHEWTFFFYSVSF